MTGAGVITAAGTAVAAQPTTTGSTTTITASPDIEAMIAGMTLDEKIGQMTWTHVYGSSADDASMAAKNQERYGVNTPAEVVEKYNLGGVLYFAWSGNTNNPQQVAGLSNGLQQTALREDGTGIPLAVTIDQEGGLVARIGPPATVLPGNMALGATADAGLAKAQGEILGSEMRAMGINVDFAPVLDLNSNPDNPVIGIRSMGEDPALVSALGVAQIDGIQAHNVGAAAKHFPGHGDTSVDSHYGLPTVTYDRATLNEHLKPFKAAIDGGVDMVMTAHIIVEAIDPEMPGTLSHKVLTGLLRDEMGFKGLVTTDALDMAAMAAEWPQEEIAVKAIQAGSDILLNSPDVDASFAGVRAAVESGEITETRLDESIRRILEWKVKRGVFEQPMADPAAVDTSVGRAENLATAKLISDHAVTLLRNEGQVLPLKSGSSVLMVGAGSAWPELAGPLLKDQGFTVTEDYEDGASPSAAYRARAVAAAGNVECRRLRFLQRNQQRCPATDGCGPRRHRDTGHRCGNPQSLRHQRLPWRRRRAQQLWSQRGQFPRCRPRHLRCGQPERQAARQRSQGRCQRRPPAVGLRARVTKPRRRSQSPSRTARVMARTATPSPPSRVLHT